MTLYHANELKIRLDFESALFQTLTYSEKDIVFLPGSAHIQHPSSFSSSSSSSASVGGEDDELDRPKSTTELLGVNVRSGHTPALLHFNGSEKKLLKTGQGGWWSGMWWVSGGVGSPEEKAEVRGWARGKVERGGVRRAEDGTWMSWGELGCAREEFEEEIWGKE